MLRHLFTAIVFLSLAFRRGGGGGGGGGLCSGYTADGREVSVLISTTGPGGDASSVALRYDPVRDTAARAIAELCAAYPCAEPAESLERALRDALARGLHDNYHPPDFSVLLPIADTSLLAGIAAAEAAVRQTGPGFHQSIVDWCSAQHPDGRCAINEALAAAAGRAADLFHAAQYDEALALCRAYLLWLQRHADVYAAGAVTPAQLTRMYMIFAESSRLVGDLNASTWGFVMVSHQCNKVYELLLLFLYFLLIRI
jgi:hypothetical protein